MSQQNIDEKTFITLLMKGTVKSKQETFPAENLPPLLIAYSAGLKKLIGRWCQSSNFLWVS